MPSQSCFHMVRSTLPIGFVPSNQAWANIKGEVAGRPIPGTSVEGLDILLSKKINIRAFNQLRRFDAEFCHQFTGLPDADF